MKTILVSNNSLATVLKESLADYTLNPTCEAFCFQHPQHLATSSKLAEYFLACEEQNPQEYYLILADAFGSTAYNETVLLLERLGIRNRATVYTGVSLPMLVQLYDEDDSASDLELWKNLQPILRHAA
ncbi:putative PTS EIIA protein (plasmid) [Selenomonas ruminantium subsp. lactilytica TAM6421]|uniref:Putative PTS EIIA protein n=1 Tax=Selenomonas ruminantium subsp. lactilytica (strain NBRC 103574 / TAM6421) TaxID=927704 RepID=I0GW36_SELRL|nr:PTS EIIA protein [Selenomonas ruminantium]BAL84973.1 putative PTS EIIA protein [Selenomonas ruminantium subsp. lactilytica TAM6421]